MNKFTHNCALITLLSLSFFASANPAKPGGETTTSKQGHNAFSMPASNLDMLKRMDFSVGNSFFRNPWVIAPATTDARDGLGPLFNTNACQGCHIKDGRGKPREEGDRNAVSMLVRLSIPATTPEQKAALVQQGVIPEPVYGGQLQDMSIPGVAPEGQINISYQEQVVTFTDGTKVSLRQPKLTIEKLNYGPMHPDMMMSARVAPVMIGLGLLESISEADILAYADPEDRNKDGISGKANQVWNTAENKSTLGRFGWKAGQPNLMQQNAGAFAGDMGLTSRFNLADDCTPSQQKCIAAPHGGKHEASDKVLKFVEFYTQHLAVPARRKMKDPQVQQGQALFQQANCHSCHVASYTTAKRDDLPALSEQVIYPYSDLLLHDMGPGLADNRPEFLANGQEWRTPPLWGLGYLQEVNGHTFLLHDGRARNIMEAILWHGGEAEASKQTVLTFDQAERDALISFLESL